MEILLNIHAQLAVESCAKGARPQNNKKTTLKASRNHTNFGANLCRKAEMMPKYIQKVVGTLETMNLQSFQTLENNINEVLCSSRRQYRDYIDLYGVKHGTVSNSKCAMPSLSCLLSFYTFIF